MAARGAPDPRSGGIPESRGGREGCARNALAPSYIPAMPPFPRRRTATTLVGGVPVGSTHPIVVQSMTNTDTADVAATVAQIRALHQAGSELVRVTVNND